MVTSNEICLVFFNVFHTIDINSSVEKTQANVNNIIKEPVKHKRIAVCRLFLCDNLKKCCHCKHIISFKIKRIIKHLIVVSGPTASGKTALAINLAQSLGCEIVSADSRQLYTEMNIGVARPSEEELAKAKHHFIASYSVVDEVDAATYERMALECISKLHLDNDYAILAGGSGMYIDVVINGLDDIPGSDEAISQDLELMYKEKGINALLEELETKDPIYYHEVDKANHVRLLRALNVIRSTGKPFSSFRNRLVAKRPFEIHYFYIDIPREILYGRIDLRVDKMIDDGLEDEVYSLSMYRHLRPLNTVGFVEWPFTRPALDQKPAIIDKIKQYSRNYAKRQVTWFKKRPITPIPWSKNVGEMKDAILDILGKD